MRFHVTLLTALTLVSLSLTACQKPLSARKKPVPQPLPYHFNLSSILDLRAEKLPHENLNAHPLDLNEVSAAMYRQLPRSLFATTPAKIKVELNEYTTTEHAGIHALSYAVTLSSHDSYGRMLLKPTQFVCSETMERGFYLDNLAGSAYKGESLANAAQSASIFNKLINTCMAETMAGFTHALIAAAAE